MQLKRKRWRLKSYENCFSGVEAVEWVHNYLQNHPAFDGNITRDQAFMLLQKFLDRNIFCPATGKECKKFQDSNFLYKFVELEDPSDIQNKENALPTDNNAPKSQIPISTKIHERKILQPQRSLGSIFKNFNKNSSGDLHTPCGKPVHHLQPPVPKGDNKSSRIGDNPMTPLALDLNNVSLSTTRDTLYNDYVNLSTIAIDPEDEDEDLWDALNISISRFSRSNSLRDYQLRASARSHKYRLETFYEPHSKKTPDVSRKSKSVASDDPKTPKMIQYKTLTVTEDLDATPTADETPKAEPVKCTRATTQINIMPKRTLPVEPKGNDQKSASKKGIPSVKIHTTPALNLNLSPIRAEWGATSGKRGSTQHVEAGMESPTKKLKTRPASMNVGGMKDKQPNHLKRSSIDVVGSGSGSDSKSKRKRLPMFSSSASKADPISNTIDHVNKALTGNHTNTLPRKALSLLGESEKTVSTKKSGPRFTYDNLSSKFPGFRESSNEQNSGKYDLRKRTTYEDKIIKRRASDSTDHKSSYDNPYKSPMTKPSPGVQRSASDKAPRSPYMLNSRGNRKHTSEQKKVLVNGTSSLSKAVTDAKKTLVKGTPPLPRATPPLPRADTTKPVAGTLKVRTTPKYADSAVVSHPAVQSITSIATCMPRIKGKGTPLIGTITAPLPKPIVGSGFSSVTVPPALKKYSSQQNLPSASKSGEPLIWVKNVPRKMSAPVAPHATPEPSTDGDTEAVVNSCYQITTEDIEDTWLSVVMLR